MCEKNEIALRARTVEEVIMRLLMDAATLENWEDRLRAAHVEVSLAIDPFDCALDLLGIPVDNTVETRACEIATETGEWPKNAYCRDGWYIIWSDLRYDSHCFLSYVQEHRAEIESCYEQTVETT